MHSTRILEIIAITCKTVPKTEILLSYFVEIKNELFSIRNLLNAESS